MVRRHELEEGDLLRIHRTKQGYVHYMILKKDQEAPDTLYTVLIPDRPYVEDEVIEVKVK